MAHDKSKERIVVQHDLGINIINLGVQLIEKKRNIPRSEIDAFKLQYDHWRDITNEILNEIFLSSDYSYKFRRQISSKKEYVNSSWQPDIKYYITREMQPKIQYLKLLAENIMVYDEQTPEDSVNNDDASVPDKVKKDMSLKTIIENSPALIVIGCIITGFMSGVGAMEYLDGREKSLREEVLAQIREENKRLKESNENLDSTVKELVVKNISQQAMLEGKPLVGNNSEVRKAVNNIDSGEISNIIKDPTKDIKSVLGF